MYYLFLNKVLSTVSQTLILSFKVESHLATISQNTLQSDQDFFANNL